MPNLLDLLREHGPLKPRELAELAGRSKNAVRVDLSRMKAEGLVIRLGDGRYCAAVEAAPNVNAQDAGEDPDWLEEWGEGGPVRDARPPAVRWKNIRGANVNPNVLPAEGPNVAEGTFDPRKTWVQGFYDGFQGAPRLNPAAVDAMVQEVLVEAGKPPCFEPVDAGTARKLYLAGRKAGAGARRWWDEHGRAELLEELVAVFKEEAGQWTGWADEFTGPRTVALLKRYAPPEEWLKWLDDMETLLRNCPEVNSGLGWLYYGHLFTALKSLKTRLARSMAARD